MTKDRKRTPPTGSNAEERFARRAAALRENLRRRKAQARARKAQAEAPAERPQPRD